VRAVEPRDITRIRWVSDARIAPDGRRVAFAVTTLCEERDEYLSQLWMVDAAGGEPRRFTTGPGRDTAPRWSPDGCFVAFLSERGGRTKPQLHVIPADGGEAVVLTDLANGVADPVWSPDSTRIAFVARTGGGPEAEREDEKRKSKPARVITTLKYKLDGEGFVHDRRPHLFVVGRDGGAPVQLTGGDLGESDPAWSPDGAWLAFSSARHDERDVDDASDIWLMPAAGGEPRRLTATDGPALAPAFAPDGAAVAYVGRAGRNRLGGHFHVFTLSVAGGAPVALTAPLDRSVAVPGGRPIWTPDGAVLFAVENRGAVAVCRVRPDAPGAVARIVTGSRSVADLSVSRDGARLAFVASESISPAEVFLAAADGSGERQLTDLNAGWKADVARGRPERLTFERAGMAVDAWIIRPFGWEPGRRYPALVNVHGGPHAQYGEGFFDEFQVYAGAGYGVVFCNPRGSRGSSEAFARAVVGDWGGGDYADVMAAVDEALRRADWIDAGRLGLMGGSYGGFMTSWAVGHTDRFRAACSERAVNNQLTMFGTSDIGHWFQVVQSGGAMPWEDPARWAGRSPITYATRIRTPLLIIHAEDDLRCPIGEAEQLFVALKMLGRDVTFVRFPGEHHELSRSGKPCHRLERFRIILDWFAGHLAPGGDPVRGSAPRARSGD
jgi:dipeptidyl aminopeptidase/acylaminoacyl peptidase